MIKNFEEVRKQLAELAQVLNAYKSEAVQLRLVELIFNGATPAAEKEAAGLTLTSPLATVLPGRKKPRRKAAARTPAKASSGDPGEKKEPKVRAAKTSGSRKGAKATLTQLVAEGFFKTPRTIGAIVEHCDHNLATKFGSNEFSGSLGRFVRAKTLKRAKNADNQYEYTQGA